MADDDSGSQLSKRQFLGILGAATGLGTAAGELAPEDGQGSLTGGTMALSKAYNVAGKLWIGPDSARSNVDAKSGRVYIGASGNGYTWYNGDSGSWIKKGLGDSSNPVPSVTSNDIIVGTLEDKSSGNRYDVDNLSGGSSKLKTSGDDLEWQADVNNDLILRNTTDSKSILRVNQDSGNIEFFQITGQPQFSTHDHSAGGMTAVSTGGLASNAATGTEIDLADIAGANITVDTNNDELDASGSGAPTGAEYVTVSLDGTLTSERTLNAGDGLALTDNGSNSDVTLDSHNISTQTAAYTASEQDVVLGDASGGAFSVTLPTATTDVDVTVKKIDSSTNGVTIDSPNSETIDGMSSITITSQYSSRSIVSDGSNYYVV